MTIENSNTAVLHEVFGVYATQDEGIFIVDVDLSDMYGERYRTNYASYPNDTFGLAPIVRQWLVDHEGEYTIEPYVPPTTEQVRAEMTPLTRAAFRTAFKAAGMTTAVIVAAIFSVEDESEQEDLQIAWEDSAEFRRLDPLVLLVADRAVKTAEEIDTIWTAAS